jgi:predicted TIM-barrel fold metal-dependent hydrolase
MSTPTALEAIPIIDVDSHVTEPADLWSSRLPAKWRDHAPGIRRNERTGEDVWWVEDLKLQPVGATAMAGWNGYMPSRPPTMDDVEPGSHSAEARLKVLDEHGVYAQILYSNLLGFFSPAFLELAKRDAGLPLACVQAYNDFLTDFASADVRRLSPLTWVPFWDLDAAVAEIRRCSDAGHRGIVFGSEFERIGYPRLVDTHWDPIFAECQERELSVNFHIGFGMVSTDQARAIIADQEAATSFNRAAYAETTTLFMAGNMRAIADIVMLGLAHRFPELKFVSVESGFGYIPYLLEAMDWQFENGGVHLDHPDWMRPSEYFLRQVYATFWFERSSFELLNQLPDNVMFETDYPHPTSLSPGPATIAKNARDTVAANLAAVPHDIARKVLCDNAAALYRVELP